MSHIYARANDRHGPNFNKALQTSSVQMPNKVLAELKKFRAQKEKELKIREGMNISDILIQNNQHNDILRKARFKSLHNSWEDAIRLKKEIMQEEQRESREWREAGRKADVILLAKHMEEAQKRREKCIELCQYNNETVKEKRALAELEKEIETQHLLKQRRQATENERRLRDMELELLKAARKNIPVLDRTEGKKHSVVLEKEGSDDFQPKQKKHSCKLVLVGFVSSVVSNAAAQNKQHLKRTSSAANN
ncbi:unnamed protein product [Oreochromis niloticus]|nr:unnamed protein product [Mustela putorius furo]CAI5648993.1 unnamed protein product [Mustela putorius furo]CAI5692870.1 unnamed protein product [Mustela putorius furo]CAI5692885.1 unnamed protein product [Mustela putorius furo]CAI5692888.1 unnamed protein product [Mustela putorius furo]